MKGEPQEGLLLAGVPLQNTSPDIIATDFGCSVLLQSGHLKHACVVRNRLVSVLRDPDRETAQEYLVVDKFIVLYHLHGIHTFVAHAAFWGCLELWLVWGVSSRGVRVIFPN